MRTQSVSLHGSTDGTLAAARFAIPGPVGGFVRRPRLLGLLTEAETRVLVLVSGPAGCGKTSVVAEWARAARDAGSTIGWVTFEEGDTAFWCYFVDCLGRLGLEVPPASGAALPAEFMGELQLLALAEAIAEAPTCWTVVIDGYEIASPDVGRGIDFLLQHTCGHLRLVLVGRVDPVLSLYRYRLGDTLAEIRAADLAFTDDEADELLNRAGANLSGEAVHVLNERVKGWAAGLRFAARALAGRDTGDQRVVEAVVAEAVDINEYLVGEVLDVQTRKVRQFLLDTSVADVLTPGLVEELAGAGAWKTLEQLARSDLFLESLADQPGCFRYFPFFRDLLRAQLAYHSQPRMVELHRRAARWYRGQGLPGRAMGYLARIRAWDEVAAEMVEGHMIGRLVTEGLSGELGRVAGQVPADLEQPAPCVVRAAVALLTGDWITCEREVSAARRTTGQATGKAAELAPIAAIDAVRGRFADDALTARALAEEAERGLFLAHPHGNTPSDADLDAIIQRSLGVASLRLGELSSARKALMRAVGSPVADRTASFRADSLGYLAVLDASEGYLTRAHRMAEHSLEVAAAAGIPPGDRSPAADVALARVALEQYELEQSERHVASAKGSHLLNSDPISRTVIEGVMAGLECAGGRPESALARLDAAAANAVRADPWLADGLRLEAAKVGVATGWGEVALQELDAMTLHQDQEAQAVAAAAYEQQGQTTAAEESLGRARAGHPPMSAQVTGMLVQVAQESRRQSPGRARIALATSLRLAAHEGLRRPFREAAPVVQRMLADPRLLGENRWLSPPAVPPERRTRAIRERPPADTRWVPDVVETLTPKELEVLAHLEEMLTTEEIADKMFVTVNTVRTHVRSILRKLGVNRRNAAVRKARRLGLLTG